MASTPVMATVGCASGSDVLLSGGARTTPGTVGSLKPIASYPSDANGNPALATTGVKYWTAVLWNGGMGGSNNKVWVFAVCSNSGDLTATTVHFAEVPGPGPSASTAAFVTTGTISDTSHGGALMGGGAAISGSVTATSSPRSPHRAPRAIT
ncbi:MAG: hypothetical protein ACRDJU_15340 [Actinomycetota bacterium]